MNMRTFAAAAVLLSTLGLPAFADACQDDIALLDKTLKSAEIDADIRAQAEDMRNQAVQLCGADNNEEGLAMTAEAKILLKIE